MDIEESQSILDDQIKVKSWIDKLILSKREDQLTSEEKRALVVIGNLLVDLAEGCHQSRLMASRLFKIEEVFNPVFTKKLPWWKRLVGR